MSLWHYPCYYTKFSVFLQSFSPFFAYMQNFVRFLDIVILIIFSSHSCHKNRKWTKPTDFIHSPKIKFLNRHDFQKSKANEAIPKLQLLRMLHMSLPLRTIHALRHQFHLRLKNDALLTSQWLWKKH